jgi:hypothetical protein
LQLLGNGLLFTKPRSRFLMSQRVNLFHRIFKALRGPAAASTRYEGAPPTRYAAKNSRPVLVVVEGETDIQFLRRASTVLQADDQSLPDLGQLERRGKLVFVPFGGDPRNWIFRFAELGCPEFHLLDREIPPATEIRRESARIVNLRPGCRAGVTNKRSLENYLHPAAIVEVRGIDVQFSDDDDVADLVAEQLFLRHRPAGNWRELATRARRRLRNRAKSWLSTDALGRMAVPRFDERDPAGEIRGWLRQIVELAGIAP